MSQDSENLYPKQPLLNIESLPMTTSIVSVTSPNSHNNQKTGPLLLGACNTITVCPFCNSNIKTAVKYSNTSRTHMTAALCCLICCCCCIPYCLDSAKNTDHYCPSCKNYLGTYEK